MVTMLLRVESRDKKDSVLPERNKQIIAQNYLSNELGETSSVRETNQYVS